MVAVGSAVDTYVVYKILTILATDWTKLPAYKLGIIDKNGNPLKKSWQLQTSAEKNAYTPLHILVFNLKRLLNKVPGTARKLGTVAAAMWLLREHMNEPTFNMLKEELANGLPTNNASPVNIAGLGPNPPVRKKPDDSFAGHAVFNVNSDTYHHTNYPRRKFQRWATMAPGMNEELQNIREYAINNPKAGIIIRESSTGLMRYIKHKE